MELELWGMTGLILFLFAVGVAFVLNWATKKKNYLKFIPFSPQGLGIIGVGLILIAGYSTAWWGYELALPGVIEPEVTPEVTFEAEGSATTACVYDYPTRTFTASYLENTGDVIVDSDGAAITQVVFTITVFRTDMLVLEENAVSRVDATVQTFYGKDENASTLYWPIDKDDTSRKYEISFDPAGVSARDQYNYFTVGSGGSKVITVTADIYAKGLAQLDNFQSKDVSINIHGLTETFTLRFVKIGEN